MPTMSQETKEFVFEVVQLEFENRGGEGDCLPYLIEEMEWIVDIDAILESGEDFADIY